ncbi:NAD(P)-dependent alcohol dehydrogenase [Actinokineospora iranica]|uniref:Aryl-alcohol dehydrogenase n=1 Tax=Actinokineospora iranica TaxID=1271860 RepID=A0A1G6VWX4_9PSEU|nr:NAD(P)-dependent alcohol dehydrogenase [Actinokineospora iranica]SDD57487.1 aryl-alcohol dehydrogenase [Actinokineospora iranica]
MKVEAAVTERTGAPFTLGELDLEAPRPGEILVRLAGVGVCHTDLVARDQGLPVPLPAVLGHEGAGVVEDVGAGVEHLRPGDHVVLTFDHCGACRRCAQGRPALCARFMARNFSGVRPDGSTPLRRGTTPVRGRFFGQSSFATHAIATSANAIQVPTDLPLSLLGPLACGIQTGAGSVLNSLRCPAGSSIAVFGTGSVACAAVLAAALSGCTTIIVVGRDPAKLRFAAELGATHTLPVTDHVVADIQDITGGGADHSLETTAAPAILRHAVDCLDYGGICGHLGAAAVGTEVSLDMSALLFSRQIRGIVEGDSRPADFIPTLIALHRQGRFPFDKLIATYPLGEIDTAVAESAHRDRPKAVVIPDQER